jgi:hypothetical protein
MKVFLDFLGGKKRHKNKKRQEVLAQGKCTLLDTLKIHYACLSRSLWRGWWSWLRDKLVNIAIVCPKWTHKETQMSLERKKKREIHNIESKFVVNLKLLMALFQVTSKTMEVKGRALVHDIQQMGCCSMQLFYFGTRRCRFVKKWTLFKVISSFEVETSFD